MKYIKCIPTFLLLGLLVSSCKVTKKYTPPTINEGNYLFRLDSLTNQGIPIAKMAWKAYYQDPFLQNYIETALQNNFDNQTAFKNIERFTAMIKEKKSAFQPTFTLNAEVQRQKQAGNSQFGSFFSNAFYQFTLNGNLAWEADIWGKIKSQQLATQAQFEKSITAQKTLQTIIIANVANTYYQLLAADKNKKILSQTILLRTESLKTIQNLKASGQGNILAVNQSEAQVEQVKIQLTDIDNQIFTLENALMLLIGTTFEQIERSTLDQQEISEDFQIGLPLEIVSNRPDVKEAELDFRSFFENHNVATASMYPTLKLSANLGFQSLDATSLIKGSSFFNTLMGGISQPILNQRRLKTQKELAKNDMEQSLLRFQKKVFEASVEVSNSLKDLETKRKNELALKAQTALLSKSLDDAKELLKYGFVNYLDVLNAQANLLNAQLQLVQTNMQKLQATTVVYRAVGGGRLN
jgi:NodT family efflux transporter outer membrane factor (OMF) lipoprotein